VNDCQRRSSLFTAGVDGSPLKLDDIVRTCFLRSDAVQGTQQSTFALTRPDAPFPLLTQGDHPARNTPAWYLHPCDTAAAVNEILGELQTNGLTELDRDVRWLESWLMLLGNVVELRS
jgi:ubiquitin-like-conjugating enzyme ATG10